MTICHFTLPGCLHFCVLPVSCLCGIVCPPILLHLHVTTTFTANSQHLQSVAKACVTFIYFYTFFVVFMMITMEIFLYNAYKRD